MLDKLRKPETGRGWMKLFAWILIGVSAAALTFLGLTPDMGSTFSGGGAAAIVNDTSIPIRSFQEAVDRETKQMGGAFNNLPAAQRRSFERNIRERTLNSLVASEVLFQSAQNHGFYAPDEAVRDELLNLPYFMQDGRFSRELYLNILAQNRLDPADFENQIRRQVTIGGVRDSFTRALKKPKQMRKLESDAEAVKLNIEFVRFEKSDIDMSSSTSEKALIQYVKDNLDKVKDYYQNNKSEFELEKEVRARHILIKGEDSLKKINEIRKDLNKENFADMAKKHSEDKGSAAKGGDLGFFGKGRMVPEFEKVAMSSEIGVISEPVQTQFGHHVIMVDEVKGGGFRELEEASLDIAKSIIEKEGRNEAMANIEKAVESGEGLGAVLSKYKMKWEETGEFGLNQPSAPMLGGATEVVTEALNLSPGEVAKKLVRSEGKAHIVRLKKITKAKVDSKEDLPEPYSSAAIESLNEWAQELRETARVSVNTSIIDR